jgi:hypothetical protein
MKVYCKDCQYLKNPYHKKFECHHPHVYVWVDNFKEKERAFTGWPATLNKDNNCSLFTEKKSIWKRLFALGGYRFK